MLLDRFAPACVMIDRKLQVLYIHGKVEDYLTFPTGEPTNRIVDMAREGLRARLRGAIGKCLEMKRPVSVIARVRRGEKSVPVKATVSPMRHPRETDGLLLVTFEDHRLPALRSGKGAARESDVQQLSDELKVTREELQSTIEQLESSNDQLKASNEEVTASNEELQSANEELETSKEELQSLNEELNTINARLQEKVGELEGTNNDVLNLLSSTAIATVFLDKELRVKRFTPASTRLLSLIPSDAGRPVADVLRRFADEMLLDDARRVLRELTPLAKEIQADDGRLYFRRITPYRTQDDRIEGVVFTFVDVSDIKQAEQALRGSEKKYRDLVESANSTIIRWKPDGEITYVNRYGLSFFGYREEEILGRNAMILVPDQDS
jgi:two-component system CheB/CheR fusion protein